MVGREEHGSLALKGLYVGDDREVFRLAAAALSLKVNFTTGGGAAVSGGRVPRPGEFKSTWLGNKAIYRRAWQSRTG